MGRSKQMFLEMTGGLRIGETDIDFKARVSRIREIREGISTGKTTPQDIDELARLLGTGEDDQSLADRP